MTVSPAVGVGQVAPVLGAPGVRQLYPAGSRRLSYRPARGPALVVVPSARAPRLLVPTGVGASARMLRRHSRTPLQRLVQDAVSWSLRTGLLPLLPIPRLVPVVGSDVATVEDHVREHVPGAAHVGVMLGPPRANGKPVLRVFDRHGRTLAFGKVAHDELSSRLVRHEAAVLQELHRHAFTHLELPRVLHSGSWNGKAVLYVSALGSGDERVPEWTLPQSATAELAESWDAGGRLPLATSPYVVALQARIDQLEGGDWLRDALDAVLARHGDVGLAHGRWHGDWAPWNMASSAGRQQVWDWERSCTGVPLGLDSVHFIAQRSLQRGGSADRLRSEVDAGAGIALRRWCGSPREADATVMLYALEILHRYVGDAGARPTRALRGRVDALRALLPAPADRVRRPERVDS